MTETERMAAAVDQERRRQATRQLLGRVQAGDPEVEKALLEEWKLLLERRNAGC